MSKITPADAEAVVKETRHLYDGLTTIAVVECHNGFKAVGKASAVDQAHYSREEGEKYSRIDALREVYAALAYQRLDTKHRTVPSIAVYHASGEVAFRAGALSAGMPPAILQGGGLVRGVSEPL